MYKIAIDNGHGIDTAGKRTPPFDDGTVIKEWQFNYPTACFLEAEMKRCGFITLMVSPTEKDTPLKDRTKAANDFRADIFVSIHFNAYQGIWGTHGGVSTHFYKGTKQRGDILAKHVQYELAKHTKLRDRGSKPSNFWVVRKTIMPAVLVECGFMDNYQEARLMLDPDYQRTCAEAIARGVCTFLATPYIPAEDLVKPDPDKDKLYRVQVGAFRYQENALKMQDKLMQLGIESWIKHD